METLTGKKHCRADWNLTDENIRNELDRNDQSNVSFYFALRWLQYEIDQFKSKKNKKMIDCLMKIMTKRI